MKNIGQKHVKIKPWKFKLKIIKHDGSCKIVLYQKNYKVVHLSWIDKLTKQSISKCKRTENQVFNWKFKLRRLKLIARKM